MSPRIARSFSTLALSLVISACAGASMPSGEPAPAVAQPAAQATGESTDFLQWREVNDFMNRMVATHGFNRNELESIFSRARYTERTVELMKPAPPGRPKNWRAYRSRFVEPVRVKAGIDFWDAHADALARAESVYGVPAEVIVGILGVETIYGRNTGTFRVIDAVTTLAFAYPDTHNRIPRMAYFRGELENVLLLARESGIDPFTLTGSYAGAIGWPQFMPGSIRRYAVDFDGDHRIDLRSSPVDAIGSIASYLAQHGWKTGEPMVFPVTVATDGSEWNKYLDQGLEAKFTLDELQAAGVSPGATAPPYLRYGLVDLQNGEQPAEYWLGANNFFTITKYNRSYFYAMAVIELGKTVKLVRERAVRNKDQKTTSIRQRSRLPAR